MSIHIRSILKVHCIILMLITNTACETTYENLQQHYVYFDIKAWALVFYLILHVKPPSLYLHYVYIRCTNTFPDISILHRVVNKQMLTCDESLHTFYTQPCLILQLISRAKSSWKTLMTWLVVDFHNNFHLWTQRQKHNYSQLLMLYNFVEWYHSTSVNSLM